MTSRQAQRLVQKVADIKRILAAEKRKFGGYDDSRGLRYVPTRYYIQLGDYKGGLAYTRWFAKAFPGDVGFPDFLFEWTVFLFKGGKLAEAQVKAWQTFCSNTYVLDKYFGRPIRPITKYEWSAYAQVGFADYFTYSSDQAELTDFSEWLAGFMSSDLFMTSKAHYIALYERLATEDDRETRGYLLKEADSLEQAFQTRTRA